MKFLEKDLETIIFEADNSVLQEKGLPIEGIKIRQLNIGNYGRCDIVAYCRDFDKLFITIYELKQETINLSSLHQIVKYRQGIISYFEKRQTKMKVKIQAVLIGRKADLNGSFVYFLNQINWLSAYTYNYSIEGLTFDEVEEYLLINEGFVFKQRRNKNKPPF